MSISVTFTSHGTVCVVCGHETIEVPLPQASTPSAAAARSASARPRVDEPAPLGSARSPRGTTRPPVLGVVQADDRHGALHPDTYARVLHQAVAESPVRLDDVDDFNVTNLCFRALEDDVRDDPSADDHPLVLDVLCDPAGLDEAFALERLKRIVNDRSNPIDAIRLLGPGDAG